jgi:hypothetical protein
LFFRRNTKKIRQRQIRRYHSLPSLNRTCLADGNGFFRGHSHSLSILR